MNKSSKSKSEVYNIEIEASKKFEVFDVSFQFMSSIQNAKTMNNQAKALQKPEKGMFCKAVAKSKRKQGRSTD